MAAATDHSDHLTAYERAVCYYTLPQVTSPLNTGLVIVYGVILLEAIALLVFGVVRENPEFVRWGAIAAVSVVVFGVVIFFGRAFINAVREQRALAQAHAAPDLEEDSGLPDPFEGHVLVRYHPNHHEKTVPIESNDGRVVRIVERLPGAREFTITQPDGSDPVTVSALRSRRSFVFDMSGRVSDIVVRRDGSEIARARRRYTLGDSSSDIFCEEPEPVHIVMRGGGFYRNDRLVGRFYLVNQVAYLDIEEPSFLDGVLAYFVAMV